MNIIRPRRDTSGTKERVCIYPECPEKKESLPFDPRVALTHLLPFSAAAAATAYPVSEHSQNRRASVEISSPDAYDATLGRLLFDWLLKLRV